jgi:hypothetical protein
MTVTHIVLCSAVLTDIDINGYDTHMETPPPSVPATFRGRPTSYRLNNDVFFMSAGIQPFCEHDIYTGKNTVKIAI